MFIYYKGFECGSDSIPTGLHCDPQDRIVGGRPTRRGSWPWIVRLTIEVDSARFMCGGTIIGDELGCLKPFLTLESVNNVIENDRFTD